MLHYQIILDCVSLTNLRSTGPWTLESVHLKGYFDVTGSREVITKNKVGRYLSMFPLVNSFTYFKTFYTSCIIFFFLPNFSQHLPRSLATWFSVHTLMKLPPNQNKQEKNQNATTSKHKHAKCVWKFTYPVLSSPPTPEQWVWNDFPCSFKYWLQINAWTGAGFCVCYLYLLGFCLT